MQRITAWLWTGRTWKGKTASVAGALVVLLVVIATATPTPKSGNSASTSSAGAENTTATTNQQAAAPGTTPKRARKSRAKPAAAKRAESTTLVSLGATKTAWKSRHQEDSRFAPGAAFDPDPSLARGGDTRYDDRYYAVIAMDGRIFNYSMRFPSGTSVSEAKQDVLASEFPRDAKIDWFRERGTCAQMQVSSATLKRETGGIGFVEFSSGAAGDSYSPGDVWDAILMVTEPSGPGGAPGC